MDKIAVGPRVSEGPGSVRLEASLEENLDIVALKLNKRIDDLVAVVLDRPRHQDIIDTLRRCRCGVRLISDGDVAAAIAPSLPNSGVDLYVGIGGSPEAVIASAAIKCLGGQQLSRMWPKNEEEKRQLLEEEDCSQAELDRIWTVEEMALGDRVIFVATGISDSPMLRGIRYEGRHCVTESILIRARNRTVRRIEAHHDMSRKTIRFASSGEETRL
jgi:fructose-1,6-bisphosphatase II